MGFSEGLFLNLVLIPSDYGTKLVIIPQTALRFLLKIVSATKFLTEHEMCSFRGYIGI